MRTMIIEGGRAAPQAAGQSKPMALVIVFVLPGPVDPNGGRRTPDFFVAVGADPSNHTQAWMGIPGGIMTVTSHCSRTSVEALMINLKAMGWAPQPGQGGKIPVQQAMSRPYAAQDIPGQLFLQYLLDLQSGMMRPEDLPPWLAITSPRSGRIYRPCGAVVGPRGPGVGSPCPDGPCQLNEGKACVWRSHSGRPQPPGQIPQDEAWRQQATMASQLSSPSNGGGLPMGGGYAQGLRSPPQQPSYAPTVPNPYVPPKTQQLPRQSQAGVVHPPGGDFVMDMSPPSAAPVGEFALEPELEPEPPPPAPPKRASRRKVTKKAPAKRGASKKTNKTKG